MNNPKDSNFVLITLFLYNFKLPLHAWLVIVWFPCCTGCSVRLGVLLVFEIFEFES